MRRRSNTFTPWLLCSLLAGVALAVAPAHATSLSATIWADEAFEAYLSIGGAEPGPCSSKVTAASRAPSPALSNWPRVPSTTCISSSMAILWTRRILEASGDLRQEASAWWDLPTNTGGSQSQSAGNEPPQIEPVGSQSVGQGEIAGFAFRPRRHHG